MKLFTAMLGILVLAASAQAGIVVTVTDLGTPTPNGSTFFSSFKAYKLTVSSDDGKKITAVDFGGTAAGGSRGIFGVLNQRTLLSDDGFGTVTRTRTPIDGALNNAGAPSIDSHILVTNNRLDAPGGGTPSEDSDSTNLPGSPNDSGTTDWGTGTFLKGTFSISPANVQTTSFDLAYLVIPANSAATYSGDISNSDNVKFSVSGVVGVPEPTSIGLVAVGSLGLLARRRKAV